MSTPNPHRGQDAAVLLNRTYVFAAFGGRWRCRISHFGAKWRLGTPSLGPSAELDPCLAWVRKEQKAVAKTGRPFHPDVQILRMEQTRVRVRQQALRPEHVSQQIRDEVLDASAWPKYALMLRSELPHALHKSFDYEPNRPFPLFTVMQSVQSDGRYHVQM
jgi:hypothetical protein